MEKTPRLEILVTSDPIVISLAKGEQLYTLKAFKPFVKA